MRKFDLSLRSSRSSYFATFRHQLTILSKTDALDEEKWLNMLGTFVKDWFRYESHFVHGRDSLVDILKDFFFQAEDGIRHHCVTGVQTCALPICSGAKPAPPPPSTTRTSSRSTASAPAASCCGTP